MTKPDWSKYTKEDKKFLLETTLFNRDFTTQTYTFVYLLLVSVSALLLSALSVYIAINGFSKENLLVPIIILSVIILSWIFIPWTLKKKVHSGINKLNVQYQEILKSLHPGLVPNVEFYY